MSAAEVAKAEAQGLIDYFKLRSKVNTSNMILFDQEGRIKKYDNPEAILEDFYPVRLGYYQKRKVRFLDLFPPFLKFHFSFRTIWQASCKWSSKN
jgi:hypothetical protein